jgi:hypothetical protein
VRSQKDCQNDNYLPNSKKKSCSNIAFKQPFDEFAHKPETPLSDEINTRCLDQTDEFVSQQGEAHQFKKTEAKMEVFELNVHW